MPERSRLRLHDRRWSRRRRSARRCCRRRRARPQGHRCGGRPRLRRNDGRLGLARCAIGPVLPDQRHHFPFQPRVRRLGRARPRPRSRLRVADVRHMLRHRRRRARMGRHAPAHHIRFASDRGGLVRRHHVARTWQRPRRLRPGRGGLADALPHRAAAAFLAQPGVPCRRRRVRGMRRRRRLRAVLRAVHPGARRRRAARRRCAGRRPGTIRLRFASPRQSAASIGNECVTGRNA